MPMKTLPAHSWSNSSMHCRVQEQADAAKPFPLSSDCSKSFLNLSRYFARRCPSIVWKAGCTSCKERKQWTRIKDSSWVEMLQVNDTMRIRYWCLSWNCVLQWLQMATGRAWLFLCLFLQQGFLSVVFITGIGYTRTNGWYMAISLSIDIRCT